MKYLFLKVFCEVKLVVIESKMEKCCIFPVMQLFSGKKNHKTKKHKKTGNFFKSVVSISNRSFSWQGVALEV